MGVISARIDDEDERVLKEARVNVSRLIRDAAHEKARRLRQERALSWLSENAVDTRTRSERLVREDRDG